LELVSKPHPRLVCAFCKTRTSLRKILKIRARPSNNSKSYDPLRQAFLTKVLKIDGIVKRPILFAPQPFSGDPKGFAKSQELGTSASNSLRFLMLNPLSLFFRKGLDGAHKSLFYDLVKNWLQRSFEMASLMLLLSGRPTTEFLA